jgi:hemolysin D
MSETSITTTPLPHPVLALLARYRAIFGAVWAVRHELAGPARLADERAFLPAALSLQETPPHPAPGRTALLICALFSLALTWACFGELDVVAVSTGRIVVSDNSKLVQPLETAVVRTIHVRDGDTVQAGQVLVELDATTAQADASRVQEEQRTALSEALRAQALLNWLSHATTLGSEPQTPAENSGLNADQHQTTQTQLQIEGQEIRTRLAKLAAELAHRQAEKLTAREVLAKLQATVPLARQREADFQTLSEQGFVASHAGQDRKRERIELERDLATAEARVAETQAAVHETRQTLTAYEAETRRSLQDRLTQARLKLAQLTQEDRKATLRHRQMSLTAPVAGTVQQLAIHTAGGVVTPAQVLMVIIPSGEPTAAGGSGPAGITAEISIDNKDIGFVQAGQHAEVKLETFNFTRYGTVPATVQWVSADAVVQQAGAAGGDGSKSAASTQAVFPARLVLDRPTIQIDGKTLRLSPGLNLSAEIKIGRRKVIDYLLSPVQQRMSESLKER